MEIRGEARGSRFLWLVRCRHLHSVLHREGHFHVVVAEATAYTSPVPYDGAVYWCKSNGCGLDQEHESCGKELVGEEGLKKTLLEN